jgi:hypothetical protein
MNDTERWLPVVGYEGYYEVSDLGRLRSFPRVTNGSFGSTRRIPGRVLRPGVNPQTGRRLVVLYRDGSGRTHNLYPLVLTAFVGPRPPGMEACHNDGDHTNDRLSNLRWDTSSENSYDIVRHGRHNNALKTHCPRRHRLDEPNLVASTLAAGRRDCLSCHKARAKKTRRLEAKGIQIDRLALADDYYRLIMKE